MGWLKLQRVVFRPAAETTDTQEQPDQGAQQASTAAAAAVAAGFSTKQACPAASAGICHCWDPWNADSAANVAYGGELSPQLQPRNTARLGLNRQGSAGPSSGDQGSGGVGGSAGGGSGQQGSGASSSQGLAGSEGVWDDRTIPREWQWSAFADEVGCPVR